jgi:hypothetical protein
MNVTIWARFVCPIISFWLMLKRLIRENSLLRQFERIQFLAAEAFLLVPDCMGSAAGAQPLLALGFQPLLDTVFFDERKVGFHCPMVGPFIVHECAEFLAWVVTAKTAEIHISIFRAIPEFALAHIIIHAVAAASVAV